MKLIRLDSLRSKMLMMFVILTAVPLIIVGLLSYQKSFNTVSGHSKASAMLAAAQLGRNIDVLFEDAGKLLELGNSPVVLHYLFSQTDPYEDAKEILNMFALYRETYKYDSVLNMTIVNLYGRGLSERKGVFQLDKNPLRNDHFRYLMNNPDDTLNIAPKDASTLDRLDGFQYPEHNVISIISTVRQRITHEVIGFIVIDLVDSALIADRSDITLGKTGYFYIADDRGAPIFLPANRQANVQMLTQLDMQPLLAGPEGSHVDTSQGKPQFIVFTTSRMTGWKIVGVVPLQEVMAEANSIRQLIIISVLLSILFAVTLYFFITTRLTRPVQVLKNKMRLAASGFLDVKVKPAGQDEIADLGRSFNTMLEQIKNLMEQHSREQQQIQKAELRTLQAQINPHFLYNTLDSIVWMAEAGKDEQVIELVQALSRFFRSNLSKGRDWISLQEELEHVRSYLIIQHMRYRDILSYEIDVDPQLYECQILKMTLQPIVENALYHGIKNKRGQGLIRIVGKQANERDLELTVEDNGVGIEEHKLAQLREQLARRLSADDNDDDPGGSFGLRNVQQRIRLYYGEAYQLKINSVWGQGTKITIRIPKQRRGVE